MECPKCRHKIYLNLTPEELIICPYCSQRMIPPEESNVCPACGGELPPGSVFCLSCGKNLMSEEVPVIDHQPTQPPQPSREDIARLVNEEPPVARQVPPESSVMPAPKAIPPQFVEEEPPISQQPAQPPQQGCEDMAHLVNEEPPAVQKPHEPGVVPVPEVIPPPFVEEPPFVYEQPQTRPVPSREDIAQPVNEEPPSVTPEMPEARNAPRTEEIPADNEFNFCIACGQKLPSGSLYCPRCGKSTRIPGIPNASVEPPQPRSVRRREDAVRAENRKPPIMQKPPETGAMQVPEEIPPQTKEEPPPIPIRYVQPKYRPVASREDISETMDDRAPVMQPFPRAKAPPRAPSETVWPKIRDWWAKAISPARDFVSGQWRLRRLFGKWAKESNIAPEEMPSLETIRETRHEPTSQQAQSTRLVFVILASIVFVTFFVVIGVTMSQCK